MKYRFDVPQLFLRLAVGLGFILPVMDRFGWLGPAGVNDNAWGNWSNFTAYSHTLMPYLSDGLNNIMAWTASIAELIFGITLVFGYKTTWAAWGSFVLTLIFALSMFCFASPRAPFNYSVFTASAASLLLACIPGYRWSIDARKGVA